MELFRQALTIMALGMALVFAFLAFVIQGVKAAAWIIHRVEGAPTEEPPGSADTALAADRRAAAVAAALHRFRQSR